MKIKVFNDTKEDWLLHSGSALGINGECRIPAHQFVEFEGPDNSELFLKVWEAIEKPKHQSPVVMVRFDKRATPPGIHPVMPPFVDPETGLSRL